MPKHLEKTAVSVTIEQMTERLVAAEIQEGRIKRPFAQREVARRAGVSPSAIESLQRGRIKYVERIAGRIERLYVAFLERQLAKLEAELAVARMRNPKRDFGTAEVAIARAKEALTS